MPQGGVDQKEDVLNAAKRELKEETGITSIEIIKKFWYLKVLSLTTENYALQKT